MKSSLINDWLWTPPAQTNLWVNGKKKTRQLGVDELGGEVEVKNTSRINLNTQFVISDNSTIANIRLDQTIQHVIGKEIFEERLRIYKSLIQNLEQQCGDKFCSPCTKDGKVLRPTAYVDCKRCIKMVKSKWEK